MTIKERLSITPHVFATPKVSFDRLTAGRKVEVIPAAGRYYYVVFLGRWIEKELFEPLPVL